MNQDTFDMLQCSKCKCKYKTLQGLQTHSRKRHGCPLEGTPRVVKVVPRKKRKKGLQAHVVSNECPKARTDEESHLLSLLRKIDRATNMRSKLEAEERERRMALEAEEAKIEEERKKIASEQEALEIERSLEPRETPECCICYKRGIPLIVVMPCRHQVTCETCVLQMIERRQKCPMCRGPIGDYIKTFT